jgi:hypothetical protein
MPRPEALPFSTPPKRSATPCRTGSSASWRVPWRAAVDADAFRRAMVDGDEDGNLAVLDGDRRGHVGAPHGVDRLRDDRAVVVARATRAAHAGRGLQAVLAHQAAHALLRCPQARMAQPRPDLAIALAIKGAVDEHLPDGLDQRGVGHGALWSRPAPWRG